MDATDPIDLDANATTPLSPTAAEAMRAAPAGNPASAHRVGRRARQALEQAREAVAHHLGAKPDQVVFTSGATEANNLAIFGQAGPPGGRLLASPIEHPCVTGPLHALAGRGYAVEWLPVSPLGRVQVADTLRMATSETRLVALMLANHEVGTLQPVAELAAVLPRGAALHCDAAQAVGKVPVDFARLGVATLSLSAHKFGGPQGVGALLVADGVKLQPLSFGGHQQRAMRPGTEPVMLAIGLAAALADAVIHIERNRAAVTACRDAFFAVVREGVPGLAVNGPPPGDPAGLPTTLNVAFPGCRADVLLMRLDLAGVACSAGAACSSGSLTPSPVLAAMGVPDEPLRSSLRFSFRPTLSMDEAAEGARRVVAAVRAVSGRFA